MTEIVGLGGVLALMGDLRSERLAVTGLLGIVAGDDLGAAVNRMESVVDALPDPKKEWPGRGHKERRQRDLATRVEGLAKMGLRDLQQLLAREER